MINKSFLAKRPLTIANYSLFVLSLVILIFETITSTDIWYLDSLFAVLTFLASSILMYKSFGIFRQFQQPLSIGLAAVVTFVLVGIISRILLLISLDLMLFSILTLYAGLLIYSMFSRRSNNDENLPSLAILRHSLQYSDWKYLLLVGTYGLLYSIIIVLLNSGKSGTILNVSNVLQGPIIYLYLGASALAVYLMFRSAISLRSAYILMISHSLLLLSVVPLVFDPIVGTQGAWYNISHAKSIDLSLPISKNIYTLEGVIHSKSILTSFSQTLPITYIILFGKILGNNIIAAAAWINPLLASVTVPLASLIISHICKVERKYAILAGISFLFSPLYLVYGLSVYWSHGLGVILFSISFASILVWVERRSLGFLLLALIFLLGVLLTHPLSGIVNVSTLILALGYVYLWKRKMLFKLSFVGLMSFMVLLQLIAPFIYYSAVFDLNVGPADRSLYTSFLKLAGSPTLSMSPDRLALIILYPALCVVGIIICIVKRPVKSPIITVVSLLTITFTATFIINDIFIKNPQLTPARLVYFIYIMMMPFVIIGLWFIAKQVTKIRFNAMKYLILPAVISLIVTGSLVHAHLGRNQNSNHRVIPLELEAAKQIHNLANGKFAVITEFNNNYAGLSQYGIVNSDAFYLGPLNYNGIASLVSKAYSNPKQAVEETKTVYEQSTHTPSSEIDDIYVVVSSYRFYYKNVYQNIIRYLSEIASPVYQSKDSEGNIVNIFRIYDKYNYIPLVSKDKLLQQHVTITNSTFVTLSIANPLDISVNIDKTILYGVPPSGKSYNLKVLDKTTSQAMPFTLNANDTFSYSLGAIKIPTQDGVYLATYLSYGSNSTAVVKYLISPPKNILAQRGIVSTIGNSANTNLSIQNLLEVPLVLNKVIIYGVPPSGKSYNLKVLDKTTSQAMPFTLNANDTFSYSLGAIKIPDTDKIFAATYLSYGSNSTAVVRTQIK